jgi:hypothetical protein
MAWLLEELISSEEAGHPDFEGVILNTRLIFSLPLSWRAMRGKI